MRHASSEAPFRCPGSPPPPTPAAVAAVAGLFWSLGSAEGRNWTVWGSALMLLASRASQVYFQVSH